MSPTYRSQTRYTSTIPTCYIRSVWRSPRLERSVKPSLPISWHLQATRLNTQAIKKGDFRIDGNIVVEVGGQDKGFSQVANQENAYVAADDIESAYMRKIPLWAFGFLY